VCAARVIYGCKLRSSYNGESITSCICALACNDCAIVRDSCKLSFLQSTCVDYLVTLQNVRQSALTRQVNNVRYDGNPVQCSHESDSAPSDGVMVPSHSNDTNLCSWWEILYYCSALKDANVDITNIKVPVKDPATAPHPASPKLSVMLSRIALYICFEVKRDTGLPHKRNSTSSQRFFSISALLEVRMRAIDRP
jgi:hypothetical protein